MEEMNIDLSKIFQLIKKNIFMILISTLVLGLMAAAFSRFLIKPKYSSNISVYLASDSSAKNVQEDYQGVMLNTKLIQTYDELIKTKIVSEDVVNQLNLKRSPEEVQKMISLKAKGESQFMNITITTTDPNEAFNIANQIVLSLKKVATELRGEDNIKLVDPASKPINPSSPNVFRNTILGMLVGTFLAISFILITNAMDTTIKRPEFIEEELGLTILGTIPQIENNQKQ